MDRRRYPESSDARALKAYLLLYAGWATRRGQSWTAKTLDTLTWLLTSIPFPNREPSPHRRELAGYSKKREALWIRPGMIEGADLMGGGGLSPEKFFDPERPFFGRLSSVPTLSTDDFLQEGSPYRQPEWMDPDGTTGPGEQAATIDDYANQDSLRGRALVEDFLPPGIMKAYRAILGKRYEPGAWWRGYVLLGHSRESDDPPGVYWLGTRYTALFTRGSQADHHVWLRHQIELFNIDIDPLAAQTLRERRRRLKWPDRYLAQMPPDTFKALQEFATARTIRHFGAVGSEIELRDVTNTFLECCLCICRDCLETDDVAYLDSNGVPGLVVVSGGGKLPLHCMPQVRAARKNDDLSRRFSYLGDVMETFLQSEGAGAIIGKPYHQVLATNLRYEEAVLGIRLALRDRVTSCRAGILVVDRGILIEYAEILPEYWWSTPEAAQVGSNQWLEGSLPAPEHEYEDIEATKEGDFEG